MKLANIRKILEAFSITPDGEHFHVKIENEPYMPLTIEGIGTGPHGHPAISVAHYYEQNGDLVQDPEMCFEVWLGEFHPYTFQQGATGYYQEVYVQDEDGKVTAYRPAAKKGQESFSHSWNVNIGHQGFVTAAKAAARAAKAATVAPVAPMAVAEPSIQADWTEADAMAEVDRLWIELLKANDAGEFRP